MKTERLRFAFSIVAAMLSLSTVAAAQDADPSAEPEAAPYDDEDRPPGAALPPGAPPPVQAVPGPGAPPPAPVDDTGFGFVGQITVSDDLQLIAAQTTNSLNGQSVKLTDVELRPAVDYFPVPNLSIGGQVVISYMSQDSGGSSRTQLGLHARVGYSFAFSPTTSIWPRVGLGYDHFSGALGGSSSDTAYTVPFEIFVPFVFQPTSHFFIGIGPIIRTDLVSKENDQDGVKATTVGLQSTIGGCFRAM